MKVLLINPDSPYLENAASYPPMGLLYVAAALQKEGCDVSVLDFAAEPDIRPPVLQHIHTYDLVGITCVTPNYAGVQEIMQHIPKGVPVMLGGIHPTLFPDEVKAETGCQSVIVGEFETVAHELVLGAVQKPFYHGPIAKPEEIPKPARELVNLRNYTPGGWEGSTPVYTSRGCPFGCNFCAKLPSTKYREIPLTQVMEEVDDCISLGFRNIVFGDDNIAANPRRLRNILALLKTRDIRFRLNMDCRKPAEDIFKLAADAGCVEISFGVESGSPQILSLMNKMLSPKDSIEAIRLTKKYGMKAKAYFMVNYPGETERTVQETLRFAKQARPDKWLLSSFAPLPGSLVFKRPDMFGITNMSTNWEDYYLVGKGGVAKPCFETRYLTYKRQEELHRMMYDGLKEVLG